MAELSSLGMIGKLFLAPAARRFVSMVQVSPLFPCRVPLITLSRWCRCPAACSLTQVFYTRQPVDFLFKYFVAIMGIPPLLRQPTLFRHLGIQSSLEGKRQELQVSFLRWV